MHGFVPLINKFIPSSDYGRAVELGKDGLKGIYKYFLIDSQDLKYGIVLTRSWREIRSNNTARRSERKRDRVAANFRRILDVALCYVILAVIVPAPHPLTSFIQTTITGAMNNTALPTSDAALHNLEKQILKESKLEDSAVKHSLKDLASTEKGVKKADKVCICFPFHNV